MVDKVIRIKIESGASQQEIEQLDNAMRAAGQRADAMNAELLGVSSTLNTRLTPTAAAVSQALNTASDSAGGFSRNAAQAGVQVEQLVGQISAGANPMTAFAQQAADIGIVLGAPLLGAVIGISAAIASVLLPSLIGGKTEVEKLDEALKNLEETSGTTEGEIYVLNDQIIRLAKSSEAAARVKLTANILEAKEAAIQASRAFEEAFNAGRLQFAVNTYASGVAGIVGVSNEVTAVTRQIGEQFGLQGQAAINFGVDVVRSIGEIQKAPTTGAFDKFSALISGAAEAADSSSVAKFAGNLLDIADKGRLAADQVDAGSKAIADMSAALGMSDEQTRQSVASTQALTQQLELQNIALKQGELAALLQAAANRTGAASVAELDPKVKELVVSNYNLEQQQKATAESSAALVREMDALGAAELRQIEADKRSEERAKREQERIDQRIANMQLESQTMASGAELQKAVRDGAFAQEEADLAYQTSARILAATTEYQQLMELDNISKEQQIQAEIAFREQINNINLQYDEAKLRMKQTMLNQETSAQQSAANAGIQLIAAFGSKSFQAQKNAAIATSVVNMAAGISKALNNPYPANLGFAAQVAAEGARLISTIKSTNLNGGGSLPSASGGASPTLPTTPQSAPTVGSFEIAGLAGLQEQLSKLDNDEVLPVSFTKRLVASLDSVQRLQGA